MDKRTFIQLGITAKLKQAQISLEWLSHDLGDMYYCQIIIWGIEMKRTPYTAEFKAEAVNQVVEKGHTVVDVAKRLWFGEGLLYRWVQSSRPAWEPVV